MHANQVNLVVDVKQGLSRQSGDALVAELGGMQGVSRAWVSARTSRMVLVDYDPALTSSRRILGTVAHRGYDARLVGL